jgi:uncharacterized membrane protein YdjX (TVP38/TMEM64 family)
MFPVTVLITATAIAFGPLEALGLALTGSLLGAMAGYAAGAILGRSRIRRLFGPKINAVSQALARRGVITVTLVRLIPVAPFTVVNVLAGASHIGFRSFALGTVLGMAPGIVMLTVLGERIGAVIRDPGTWNAATLMVVAAAIVVGAAGLGRLFKVRYGDRRVGGSGTDA